MNDLYVIDRGRGPIVNVAVGGLVDPGPIVGGRPCAGFRQQWVSSGLLV